MFDSNNSPTMHFIKKKTSWQKTGSTTLKQHNLKLKVFSKTEPGRKRKFEQTNHKHRNQNCNQKSSHKQKPKPRWLHR